MKALNIFTSVAAAMIFFGCNDSEVVNPVEPKPGQEVDFTISYKDANNSRTIYGDEVDDGTKHYFPVNWVSTDQVFVMSDACNPATGQYGVGFEEGQQASAGKLKVIGDGLKWNTTATPLTGNFYSIYPYDKVAAASAAPADRKVTVRMPHIQNDYVTANGNTLTAAPDMDAALLYAQTNEATNDQAVKLHYYNLATALRFELQGPANGQNGVMIQEVSLIAPNGLQIAGNFELEFSNGTGAADNGVVSARPTFTPGTVDGSNLYDRVIIYSRYKDTGANLVLNTGDKVELNAFFMINGETNMVAEGKGAWKIQVKTLDKLYSLPISKVGTGKDLTLKPGEIQRLGTLPALSTESTSEWDVSNWMVNIPRNTYISEISVPGSWNSLNGDFQTLLGSTPSVEDITNQYNIGARAFHFDTRWKWSQAGGLTGAVTSGSVGALGIADGTDSYRAPFSSDRVMGPKALEFATALNTLAGQVKSGEYMILMCTFAQTSWVNSAKAWYTAISEACNTIENKANIFDASAYLESGKTLSNAIVSDVLGKLIVVINMEGDITPANLPASSKCLFVNAPLTLTESMFATATSYNKGSLYANKAESDVTLYNTQAQITARNASFTTDNRGYAPTLTQRQTVAGGILAWALANYSKEDYSHNAWMYLGLGGYTKSRAGSSDRDNSYTEVAENLNNWIDGKVKNMKPQPTGNQTRYFPVGIVLMNFVNNATYGTPVVKNILLLNNRYGLEYDPTQPAWPNQTQNLVESASRNHASGFNVNSDSWTAL